MRGGETDEGPASWPGPRRVGGASPPTSRDRLLARRSVVATAATTAAAVTARAAAAATTAAATVAPRRRHRRSRHRRPSGRRHRRRPACRRRGASRSPPPAPSALHRVELHALALVERLVAAALMAEWWTNRSLLPSSGVMKPNPLSLLNHFTVPFVRIGRSPCRAWVLPWVRAWVATDGLAAPRGGVTQFSLQIDAAGAGKAGAGDRLGAARPFRDAGVGRVRAPRASSPSDT
jgi:hypothetical protein